MDLKVFSPQPLKEKAPGAERRSLAAGSPPRAAPRGREGEPAIPHLPRRPAPAPSSPAPDPRAPVSPGLRRCQRAAGPRAQRFHLSSPSPRSRGRGALTPPPASLSHRRQPPFPAAQATPALTWFKSSHKTRTASRTRPLGAASAAHWLRHKSWARLRGKQIITIGRPGEGGAREKNNSLAASSLSPPPSDSRATPIRLKYTENKPVIPPPQTHSFHLLPHGMQKKSPAKSVINFGTWRKIAVAHR